jgi:pyridoxamine 5'-phosphate oxidase
MSFRSFLRSIRTAGRGVLVGLPEAATDSNPFELFGVWLAAARESGMIEPTAMTLATATADGAPSARMVLLKGFDERGFVFYTNYESRKAIEISENDRVSLVFYWPVLLRQVTVEGQVQKVSREESAAYFATRSRGSQLGAWASHQSRPLGSREELVACVEEMKERFRDRDVELPPFWGGYRVVPQRIHFWQGRSDRLHDRIMFERDGDGWVGTRLNP